MLAHKKFPPDCVCEERKRSMVNGGIALIDQMMKRYPVGGGDE